MCVNVRVRLDCRYSAQFFSLGSSQKSGPVWPSAQCRPTFSPIGPRQRVIPFFCDLNLPLLHSQQIALHALAPAPATLPVPLSLSPSLPTSVRPFSPSLPSAVGPCLSPPTLSLTLSVGSVSRAPLSPCDALSPSPGCVTASPSVALVTVTGGWGGAGAWEDAQGTANKSFGAGRACESRSSPCASTCC